MKEQVDSFDIREVNIKIVQSASSKEDLFLLFRLQVTNNKPE